MPVGVGPGELEAPLLRVALARVGTRLRRPLGSLIPPLRPAPLRLSPPREGELEATKKHASLSASDTAVHTLPEEPLLHRSSTRPDAQQVVVRRLVTAITDTSRSFCTSAKERGAYMHLAQGGVGRKRKNLPPKKQFAATLNPCWLLSPQKMPSSAGGRARRKWVSARCWSRGALLGSAPVSAPFPAGLYQLLIPGISSCSPVLAPLPRNQPLRLTG